MAGHAVILWTVCAISGLRGLAAAALLGTAMSSAALGPSYTFLVDSGPGAAAPLGQAAPRPVTRGGAAPAPRIEGFFNTRSEAVDLLLQPAFGTRTADWASRYDPASIWAKPGYYAVTLTDLHVHVELTATERVALHRYTFPRPGKVQVLVQTDAAEVVVRGREVAGSNFLVRFDRDPIKAEPLPSQSGSKVLTFDLTNGNQLQARVSVSNSGIEGARLSMAQAQGRRFDATARDADEQWADVLGRIRIEGSERMRRDFYTALYRVLSSADGARTTWPLLSLVVPEKMDARVQNLIDQHRVLGFLPTWGRAANPALVAIAGAMAQGFHGFNANEALAAMLTTATTDRPDAPPWGALDIHGYFPFDIVASGSVAKTLEAGIGDDAVARVARLAGTAGASARADLASAFGQRAQGWRKLLDPETLLMRERSSQGQWGEAAQAAATFIPAQHDPSGLVHALGGRGRVGAALDQALLQAEPDEHLAWLYAWTDAPWKGHQHLRKSPSCYCCQWNARST